jgi:hypothetical protein
VYDHKHSEGFIRLFSLPMRIRALLGLSEDAKVSAAEAAALAKAHGLAGAKPAGGDCGCGKPAGCCKSAGAAGNAPSAEAR